MPVAPASVPLHVRCLLVVAAIAATFVLPGSALAGRLVVTGHDADSHCVRDSLTAGNAAACAFVASSVKWVRAGAPDPTKPVLILDRGALDFQRSVDLMAAGGAPVPYQVVDPRSDEFNTMPINVATYSAILIASSKDDPTDPTPQDLDELTSTPDSDAINARAAAISTFFDAHGGLDVMSGGSAARANSAKYYSFLKITRGGQAVAPPFTLEPIGRTIGWQDARAHPGELDSINCCETHVSFELPAPESPLKVAELDTRDHAITMVADTNDLASVEEPRTNAQLVFMGAPGVPTRPTTGYSKFTGGTKAICLPRNAIKLSLHRPDGIRFSKLVVYVNGRKTRTVSGRSLGSRSRTRPVTIRLSTKRSSKLRIVVTTASGRNLTYRQTFKIC